MSLKNKPKIETVKSLPFEIKALNDSDDGYFYFEGYLSTYGNIDHGGDVMEPGCFDESLKSIKPDLLWQHKWGDVVGVFEEIKSDDKGLFVKGKLPKEDDIVKGRIIPQMKVGSVRSMSIGYAMVEYNIDDEQIRHITKCDLYEGSLVSMPMNPEARITSMKAMQIDIAEQIKTKRDFEKALRDSGAFSAKSAVYLASKFREDAPRDSANPDLKALTDELKQFAHKLKNKRA